MALSPIRRRFAEEYIVDLNGAAAAERAGYSKKRAKETACELLKMPEVQELVQQLKQERCNRTQITADRVLQEIAVIGFADIQDYIEIEDGGALRVKTFEEMKEGVSRAFQSYEEDEKITEKDGATFCNRKKKFKLHDKLKALEMLAKHTGVLSDRLKIEGDPDKPITVLPDLSKMTASDIRALLKGE